MPEEKRTSCAFCGKPFPGRQKKYCSRECTTEGLRTGAEKVCVVCEETFYVNARRSKAAKICSENCRVTWMRRNKFRGNCATCGTPIVRTASLVRGKQVFCSHACFGRDYGHVNRFLAKALKDSRGSAAKRGFIHSISYADLETLWQDQGGRCAYSGILLKEERGRGPLCASLDRIDSSRGYEPGNVQFVCFALNIAKQETSHEEFQEFLTQLAVANFVQPLVQRRSAEYLDSYF